VPSLWAWGRKDSRKKNQIFTLGGKEESPLLFATSWEEKVLRCGEYSGANVGLGRRRTSRGEFEGAVLLIKQSQRGREKEELSCEERKGKSCGAETEKSRGAGGDECGRTEN